MKKNYLYLAVASLMVLQSCTDNSTNDVILYPTPGDSDVEICLKTKSTGISTDISSEPNPLASRAAVDAVEDLNEFGLFCLARETQETNQNIAPIDWKNWSGCIMNNVRSTIEDDGSVSWGDKKYYYPISNFYAYDFYGYYPYVENEQITIGEDLSVRVSYTLDGTQDIIAGRATDSDAYAYSARYFRTQPGSPLPEVSLKHMLTRLKFKVKTGNDVDESGVLEATKFKIKSIKIKDAYSDIDLKWVNSTSILDGNITVEKRTENVADFILKDDMGAPVTGISLPENTTDLLPVGESVMLLPDTRYLLQVELENKVDPNDVHTTESPLVLSLDYNYQFLAGSIYTVTITINGPKEVKLNAKLNNWQDSGQGPHVEV